MKKILIKIMAGVLLSMSILPIFSSCSEKTEQETAEETVAVTGETVEESKKVFIVKPQTASEQIERLASGAAEIISEQAKYEVEVVSDSEKNYEQNENYYYVLFGDTAFEQSKKLSASAEDNKMYYAATEDSIAVYAKTEQLLSIASEKLFADCIKDGKFEVGAEYTSLCLDGSTYVKANWGLNCPAVTSGRLNTKLFNIANGVDPTKDASFMHIVNLATTDIFNKYTAQLEELGYKKDFENKMGEDLYASYIGPLGTNIYVYLTKATFEMRVIVDNVSTPLSEFNYKLDASKDTRLYMFKMYAKSEDLFLIHLADNSWIIIDGAYTGNQLKSPFVKDIYDFMVERSNLAEGEKLQISCWYLSHAHEDHFYSTFGLVHDYGDKMQIHRVIDNTPVNGFLKFDYRADYEKLLKKIKEYNPDLMYLKVHTGMIVELADTSIEFLFTHEDYIAEYQSGLTTNPNYISLVSVFDIAGLTMLETGDNFAYNVYKKYDLSELTTDIVKIAHHYYDKTLDNFYKDLYNTGKVAYFYCSRNYVQQYPAGSGQKDPQEAVMSLFGSKYVQGSSSKTYEFYRNGSSVVKNVINN